jgi:oxygen-dependent protoporphyrinogen oxidase
MSARRSVVIVGGGISALAAAWELTGASSGPTPDTVRVEIVEASRTVGGALQRTRFAGRDLDCGADGFLARRPEAVQLVRELGLDDELEPINASGAWIFLRGRLRAVPTVVALGVPTSASSLKATKGLSTRARTNAWRDEHFPRAMDIGSDATIGEIVRRKLGDEIAYQLVEPMIGGIQAGRIDDLSAASVFPALLEAARSGGSLMKALAAKGPVLPGPTGPRSEGPTFYSLRHSVGSLCEQLETKLRERSVIFTTSTPVTAIRRTKSEFYRWEVDTATATTPANCVVVCTAAKVTASLLGALDPALRALDTITSASAAMVTFCVARSSVTLPATGTGVLVPLGTRFENADSMMVTAVTFLDRKWPHLANDDTILLRAHVGRIDDERFLSMSDHELTTRVQRELSVVLSGFPAPLDSMVVRWPSGLPQYRVGHADLVASARRAATSLGVCLAGLAYDGVGIPASIGSGREAARDARNILDAL